MTPPTDGIIIDGCSFFLQGYGERQTRSGVTAIQITAAYPDDTFEQAVRRMATYFPLVRTEPRLAIVTRADQIPALHAEGRVGIILTFQGADPIGDRLELAEALHRIGLRVLQLTYNERNAVGDGCCEPSNAGLSRFGRRLVQLLNEIGVLIDLSHAGARTSLEAIDLSVKPCIFSHSNPAALFPNPRNVTDEQMKAVAAKGGLVGISSYPPITWDGSDRRPSFDDLLRAIDYATQLVGPRHVAIGTDSVATTGAYPADLAARLRASYPEISGGYHARFAGVPSPGDLEGFAGMPDLPKLRAGLLARGYAAEDVAGIMGENLLRVYREAWG